MMDRNTTNRPSGCRRLGLALGAVLVSLTLATPAQAQTKHNTAATKKAMRPLPNLPTTPAQPAGPVAGTNQQVIYGGQAASDSDQSGITVADWGGGTVETTANQSYMQGHSLKIVTKGPYQGGQILFANPVSLGNLPQEKSRYFQLVIQVAQAPANQE
ncbi:MAG TPA: hypothetical protein VFW40_02160, partial [Capsulimonadaceae bacterium]|nr:hypothetical protein [Capsulimonadaceae bacterium]